MLLTPLPLQRNLLHPKHIPPTQSHVKIHKHISAPHPPPRHKYIFKKTYKHTHTHTKAPPQPSISLVQNQTKDTVCWFSFPLVARCCRCGLRRHSLIRADAGQGIHSVLTYTDTALPPSLLWGETTKTKCHPFSFTFCLHLQRNP